MIDFSSIDFFSIALWQKLYGFAKWIFIILDVFFICSVVYLWRKGLEYYPPFVPYQRIPYLKGIAKPKRGASEVSMKAEWDEFVSRARSASDETLPLVILEADKFTDNALQKLGFPGNTMLERIQALARDRKMKTLEAFWRAHKTRNEIAHAPNFILSRSEADRHLVSYQKFLKELGVI